MIEDPFGLMRRASDAYIERLRIGGLDPAMNPLPYDFVRYGDRTWRLLGAQLVQDELRDLTNILNRWQSLLQKWQAWNEVLKTFNEQDSWALRYEYLESDAHQCLTFPSAVRDAIAFVATNGIHQVRLATEANYEDRLDGDPTKPRQERRWLSRSAREKQLGRLLTPYDSEQLFIQLLQGLDDKAYRQATLDYRNEHNHALAPCLEIGETRFVNRIVKQATMMVRRADGRYQDESVPGKMQVSYGFGGRPPLDIEVVRVASLSQYVHARDCFDLYVRILDTAVQSMPLRVDK